MSISQGMLAEFDIEASITRPLLERVPEADALWKPHPKSHTMGDLAAHIANLMRWGQMTMEADAFDLSPVDGDAWIPPHFTTVEALLATFDANVAATRAAVDRATDQQMIASWSLLNAGKPLFTMPRVAVLRSFVVSHSIHHRGQLSVYLRLRDVPLPRIYGPTADSP